MARSMGKENLHPCPMRKLKLRHPQSELLRRHSVGQLIHANRAGPVGVWDAGWTPLPHGGKVRQND